MTDDRELDELLRLVDDPLPLRGDREEDLLDQLLDDLGKGPLPGPAETGRLGESVAEIVPIDLLEARSSSPKGRIPVVITLAVAAALIVIVGLALLVRDDNAAVDITDIPDPSTPEVTTTTEPLPVLSVEEACIAFAAEAPDRLDLRERISNRRSGTVTDLDLLLDAFDRLLAELERRDDVEEALTSVRRARGGVALARANIADGVAGDLAFGSADDALRLLQLDDARFADCWRF